jgi:acetaldehyde dehydrogenase (acetylating)
MKKSKVGIIGTGNIGSNLLIKVQRSEFLECGIFAGIDPGSKGIQRAKEMGVPTSLESIEAIQKNPDCCDIVFDATSAKQHLTHAKILRELNKFTIDLTPSKIGKMCIPILNLEECLEEMNVNLITCGGQASVPIAAAIAKVHPEVEYIEVIGSIASKSAGPGTRANIDEFTQTTKEAVLRFTQVPSAKAIVILNPADPPITMNNTIYAKLDHPKIEEITQEVLRVEKAIQKYMPGYRVILKPVAEKGRTSIMVKVEGAGDFLPKYAGNLDIITCAAINLAEEYSRRKMLK